MASITSSGLLHASGDYFETAIGQAVYLAGDHTWTDNGSYSNTGQFDFGSYLNTLTSEGANFTRLWAPDSFGQSNNAGFGTPDTNVFQYTAGSTTKFDLTQFNQAYFDTLRANVQAAAAKGIYVDVMLFFDYNPPGFGYNTWSSNPWNGANNVNGTTTNNVAIEQGTDPHTLALQEAYVAKVLDTLKDMPNVLYEVANEARYDPQTYAWENQIIDFVHQYESSHGYMQHPVGMTSLSTAGSPTTNNPAVLNAADLASDADWVSPTGGQYQSNPPANNGAKVVVADTDHIFGIGGNADWVWQQFTRGQNVLIMDDMAGTGLQGVLQGGTNAAQQAGEASERRAVGETTSVAGMFDMSKMTPSSVSSTGYALANPGGGDYAIYASNGGSMTVNLSGSAGQVMNAEWVNVSTGQVTQAGTVTGASSALNFNAPFSGGAALILTPAVSTATGASGSGPTSPTTSTTTSSTGSGTGSGTVSNSNSSTPSAINYLDIGSLQAGATSVDGVGLSLSGAAQIAQGSLTDVYAAPVIADNSGTLFNDTANGTDTQSYLSTGAGSVILSLPTETHYLGLLWGSVDKTNALSLYDGSNLVETVTGAQLGAIAGSNGSAYVNINSAVQFDKVVASNNGPSFEFSNVAYGAAETGSSGVTVATGPAVSSSSSGTLGTSSGGNGSPLPPDKGPTPISMAGPTIGTGPDTLALAVSQDYWNGSAEFTVEVNGKQVGGVQTIDSSVLNSAGGEEAFTFKGDFGSGTDQVEVNYINDAWGGSASTDRNLYVNSVSIDGVATTSPAPVELDITEGRTFSVDVPAAAPIPTPTPNPNPTLSPSPVSVTGPTIGTGPDTLALAVSQDYWKGSAQFTVDVNGNQVGGVQTVDPSVLNSAGGTESYMLKGDFSSASGTDTVRVNYLNDAWGGSASTDRNLYVTGLSLDGQATSATMPVELTITEGKDFSVVAPTPTPVPTPTPTPVPTPIPVPTPTQPAPTPDPAPPSSGGVPSTLPIPSTTVLTVGANGEYKTLAAAAQHAIDGDTIFVQAGTYTNDFTTVNDFTPTSGVTAGITIQAVGGMVNEVATIPAPNNKGLMDEYGNVTVNGFSFSGATIPDSAGGNGAGIRYEGGNLTLNDDYFHNNEDGLLGNADPNGTITINNSQFSNNGSGSGYTHNIYVGDIKSVTVMNSTFSGANVGHEFKSRAQNTTILFSNLQDGPSGTASYDVDTPNGGQVTLIGDTVQKSPDAGNPVLITTGEEGAYANSHLIAAGNTIISDKGGAIGVRNDGASATVAGNAVYGLNASQLQQGSGITATGNSFSSASAAPTLNTTSPFSAGASAGTALLSGLSNANPAASSMLQADLSAVSLSASDISSSSQTIAAAIMGTEASQTDLSMVSTALAGYISNMRSQTMAAATVTHSA